MQHSLLREMKPGRSIPSIQFSIRSRALNSVLMDKLLGVKGLSWSHLTRGLFCLEVYGALPEVSFRSFRNSGQVGLCTFPEKARPD